MKVELNLSNYVTKTYSKNVTGVDTSSFSKKIDLANLKSDEDKSCTDELKKVLSGLSSLKFK